jgi:hypothetical protein
MQRGDWCECTFCTDADADALTDAHTYTCHHPIHTTLPRAQVIYFVVPVTLGMTVMSMVTEGGSWHQGVLPSSIISSTKPSPSPHLLATFYSLDDMYSAFTMPRSYDTAPCIRVCFAILIPSVP